MKILLSISFSLLTLSNSLFAQVPTPAPQQQKPIAIIGATIHDGKGNIIQNKNLFFNKGIITAINNDTPNQDHDIINASNMHLYPGFILPNSHLGLIEVEAVRATADFEEKGFLNPNIRSLIAYNTESEIIPTFKFNGVLLAQIAPVSYEGIAGTSSIVQLDAWNWEDAAIKKDNIIHLTMPQIPTENAQNSPEDNKKELTIYLNKISQIKKFFEDASTYSKFPKDAPLNIKLQAMKGLFDGTQKLFIHAEDLQNIQTAINLCQQFQIKNITLVSTDIVIEIIDQLKNNNISVILNGVHRLPSNLDDMIDLPFSTPAKLFKNGITIGLTQHKNHISNGRNLPFIAGHTAAFDLSKEEALSLITSNNAKILGIDDKYGSIEVGKSATLFISQGDALDMQSNKIEHAFIDGRQLNLDAKQQKLYQKYKNKYLQNNNIKP